MHDAPRTALACHPSTPNTSVSSLEVQAARASDGALDLTYTLIGVLDELRLTRLPGDRSEDPLWRHTCFEVFVAAFGASAYLEFNFSPSLAWAAYALVRRREPKDWRPSSDSEPRVVVDIGRERLVLEARIPLRALFDTPGIGAERARFALASGNISWRLGVSAVIEDQAGLLSYWALRHPPGDPDFHDPESFLLAMPARGSRRADSEVGGAK